ncbi:MULTISPECIES: hypothetical protein [Flavobacteriaceae]|uniref:hypothetical protein n=1 Tax=Flavobacteriaceae TaxID=49546 RepID=UPI001492F7CC|nr:MULTISPECIES: hypothetical protein [Allomuricauda]MDC6366548.1 hypothetical protein [Muricauda sp. AC10]
MVQYDLNMKKKFANKILKQKQSHVNFIESYQAENKVGYIFSNNSRKKFFGLIYDFESEKIVEKPLDFKLEREDYLVNYSHDGKFYILAQIKNTRKLKFHVLDINLNYETHIIDLGKSDYYKNGTKQDEFPKRVVYSNGTIKDSLLNYASHNAYLKLVKRHSPNLNEVITHSDKIYLSDEKLLITLDSNNEYTNLIEINQKDSKTTIRQISKTDFGENLSGIKTNSFILDNLLFLLKGDKKKVFVKLYNLDSNKSTSVFSFHRNSPYLEQRNILLNQNLVTKHNIDIHPSESNKESVQKRLQKIMKGGNKIGLRALDSDQSFLLMLGGYKKTNGAPMTMPGSFGAVGGLTMGMMFGNYTFVRDESLYFYLDKQNFDLDLSDFEDPYQKMEDLFNEIYDEKARRKISWKTKFQIDSDYYLGYLDRRENIYYIRKFN